jgi:hypothetical protein
MPQPPATEPPPGPTGTTPPPAPDQTFGCTLVIGTEQTAEWYDTFESFVDNGHWELIHKHSGFVELWADAHNGVWSLPTVSACAAGASMPDRIIFLALSGGAPGGYDLMLYSLDMWLPPLRTIIKNLQAKYPSARRIELMTYVRAPMNKPCPGAPDYRSMIGADQDRAMAMVAAENPGLVTVAPQFAAASCADFGSSIPHSTAAARKAWGKMIAEHYGLGK